MFICPSLPVAQHYSSQLRSRRMWLPESWARHSECREQSQSHPRSWEQGSQQPPKKFWSLGDSSEHWERQIWGSGALLLQSRGGNVLSVSTGLQHASYHPASSLLLKQMLSGCAQRVRIPSAQM